MTPAKTAIRERLVQAIETVCVFTPEEDRHLIEITKHFTCHGSITPEQRAFVERLIAEKGAR